MRQRNAGWSTRRGRSESFRDARSADPESSARRRVRIWIPGSRVTRAPRNDGNSIFKQPTLRWPCCLVGAGHASLPFHPRRTPREWSAARRPNVAPCGAGPPCDRRGLRAAALHGGDFCSRGRASGGRSTGAPRVRGHDLRQAFARLHRTPVQPSKAEPRSGPGRLPATSRVQGYEPHPQAPHPPPTAMTPHDSAPGRSRTEMRL